MGTEAFWVPLAISAIGAGASGYNTYQQQKRQEDLANQGMRTQQMRQHEADRAINQNLEALSQSNPDSERQASLEGFMQALRANSLQQSGGANVPGTASDRAKREAATGTAAIQNYGTNRADILSRLMAPTLQRVGEANLTNRTGSDVTGIGRNAQGDAWINQLRMAQNVRNPWIDAAGQVAQAYGGNMAMGSSMPSETDILAAKRNATIASGYVPPKTKVVI
jgi:hypothetical protein